VIRARPKLLTRHSRAANIAVITVGPDGRGKAAWLRCIDVFTFSGDGKIFFNLLPLFFCH
jgi:ABC-type polar amino acid transport system ATPase subunit